MSMNAATYHKFGDPAKVIEIEDQSVPTAKNGEVVIRMIMSPIHNHDLITIRGDYGYKPALPAIGGSEAVGTITAIGQGVEGFKIGDRVATAGAQATWAQYFSAPAAGIIKIPAAIDNETAAQALGMPSGAVLALNEFEAERGDWILVNAGAGAIGHIMAAVGKARGLNIALLVRSKTSRDRLAKVGDAAIVVATDEAGWKKDLQTAIGKARVRGGVDMVGGSAAGELAHFLSEHGLLLSFGAMSNAPLSIDASDLIFKRIEVRGFWSSKATQEVGAEAMRAVIQEILTLTGDGRLTLPVDRVVTLDHAADAMAAAAKSQRLGKVLIAA